METIPLSEAKARLSEVIDSVHRTHERAVLTRNGHNVAVVVAVEDWDSLQATLDLLSDPEAVRRVDQARHEVDLGHQGKSIEQVRAELQARLDAEVVHVHSTEQADAAHQTEYPESDPRA